MATFHHKTITAMINPIVMTGQMTQKIQTLIAL
jgi:hypothetical protein